MNKSVLVIDTPENCLDCQFCYELDEGVEACCSISDDDKDASLMKKIDCEYGYCQGKPDWCPLKPLQEYKSMEKPGEYEYGKPHGAASYLNSFQDGHGGYADNYNYCPYCGKKLEVIEKM